MEDEAAAGVFDEPISRDEVTASIRNPKLCKSAGPDKIVSEMLKYVDQNVADFLVQLFNKLYDEGIFPKEWSKSIIVPIHKKGDANIPDSYRGIALTSVLSKVYTHILNKRLTGWAEQEEKILEQQAGFRAGFSTIDHIFTLYGLVQKHLQRHTKFYVAFVDLKKAFDTVNRNALWAVLRKAGVNGKLYRALKGIYASVSACVCDKCSYTKCFECPRGVKQGCLLSPLMFSFFVKELAVEVSRNGKHGMQMIPGAIEIFLLLFADDVILMSSTPAGLQNHLNHLKNETDRLYLSDNLDKTHIMVFRMGGHLAARERWVYGDEKVKVTNAYQYLGITFTTKLCIDFVLSDVGKKGKKRCNGNSKSYEKIEFLRPYDILEAF